MVLLITAFFMITVLSIAAIIRLESENERQAGRQRRLKRLNHYRWVD